MKAAGILMAHAVAGWALCGATMGVGMAATTLSAAILVHLVAAPVFFAAIGWVYFRWFAFTGPLSTAAAFTAIVIALDVVVVALAIQGSFAMFRSVAGTWLPFALIFLATWLTGRLAAGRAARATGA